MTLKHLIHYARQGIQRDRRRAVIAVLAVAFGVMALTAMTTVSEAISTVLLADPRYEIGGDAWLWRDAETLSEGDLAQIAQHAEAGGIERWAPVAESSTLMLKVPGSGRVTFLRDGVGFEPGTYPMVGEIVLRSGEPLEAALREPGGLILTRDVADARDLRVGDTVLIGNRLGGSAEPFRVAGIAVATPAYHGSTVYFSLETAPRITGRPQPITHVAVTWEGSGGETRTALERAGWHLFAPDTMNERTRQMRSTFNLMLKGAGLLGLMVGGIGIANTMQVLLRGRREEVAVLKSLGYARRDVMRIFVAETALIGLGGSLLGAAAGVGLSAALVRIASNVVTLFITWRFRPGLTLGGIAAGVVTAVLFAADAILRASGVRPADVFRRLPEAPGGRARALLTFAAVALPFGAVAALVMGSLWQGAAVLGAALAGLVVMGGLLGGIRWLAVRLLPTFNMPLLRMARNRLRAGGRGQGRSTVFAMIALFTGALTLGLSMTIIRGAVDQLETQMLDTEGYNLVALTGPDRAAEAESALRSVSDTTGVRYEAALEAAAADDGTDLADALGSLSLQGRDALWDVTVSGEPWGAVAHGAYMPAGSGIETARIRVTGFDGTAMTLPVAGTYTVTGTWDRALLPEPEGILVSGETLRAFGADQVLTLAAAEVAPDALEAAAREVGAAVPEMMVFTTRDVNGSFRGTFRNLAAFAIAMAGLALTAGAVLIANAVGLAMIERRHEIGVLKAVGYTRGQVLRALLFEYGLIGSLASGLGLLGVIAFVTGLPLVQEAAEGVLTLGAGDGLLIMASAVGLTLLAAMGTAWGPTSLRPSVVLTEEG